jgi:hypothetical protein
MIQYFMIMDHSSFGNDENFMKFSIKPSNNNLHLSAVKITGELMVGFGQGTRNNNNGRNATEGGNAESLNNTLVSDTDSTTSCADCNSSVSEMDSLVEQDSMLGSFDLGLDSGAILDAHDEIGMLVKEALMDFVLEE